MCCCCHHVPPPPGGQGPSERGVCRPASLWLSNWKHDSNLPASLRRKRCCETAEQQILLLIYISFRSIKEANSDLVPWNWGWCISSGPTVRTELNGSAVVCQVRRSQMLLVLGQCTDQQYVASGAGGTRTLRWSFMWCCMTSCAWRHELLRAADWTLVL